MYNITLAKFHKPNDLPFAPATERHYHQCIDDIDAFVDDITVRNAPGWMWKDTHDISIVLDRLECFGKDINYVIMFDSWDY